MIIFYHKKTGEIIGTVEGRVHFQEHMKVTVSRHNVDDKDIGRIVIGYEDTGEEGKELIEHNLHLWKHQLVFEDPIHPKKVHQCKVKLNKKGEVVDFIK